MQKHGSIACLSRQKMLEILQSTLVCRELGHEPVTTICTGSLITNVVCGTTMTSDSPWLLHYHDYTPLYMFISLYLCHNIL